MIEFTDVVKSYEQGNKALNGVTMQIDDGEFCFLVGPSGSGKSTIIKLITGELRPTSGAVKVNGWGAFASGRSRCCGVRRRCVPGLPPDQQYDGL